MHVGVDDGAYAESKGVEQVDQPPDADAVAVVAQPEREGIGHDPAGGDGEVRPEVLDVEADIKGKPSATGELQARPGDDRKVGVRVAHGVLRAAARTVPSRSLVAVNGLCGESG